MHACVHVADVGRYDEKMVHCAIVFMYNVLKYATQI